MRTFAFQGTYTYTNDQLAADDVQQDRLMPFPTWPG